jgi:hypothetical protein
MPFTLLHLAPALLIALLLFSMVNIVMVAFASLVPDIDYIFFGGHSIFHTLLGATLLGLVLGFIGYSIRDSLPDAMRSLFGKKTHHFNRVMYSAMLGTWSHVLIDALSYPDVQPFFPLPMNPLYGLVSPDTVFIGCIVSLVIVLMWAYYKLRLQ